MRKYEGIFILNPEFKEEDIEAQVEKIKKTIIENKGEIENVENWGKRKLAYSIKKKNDGSYIFFMFKSDPMAIKELDRRFRLTEPILRFLLVIHDPVKQPLVRTRRKKEFIKFSSDKDVFIDYKNPDLLGKFLTDRGKIVPRRMSGVHSKYQRKLTTAIKRARFLGLLPYVDEVYR